GEGPASGARRRSGGRADPCRAPHRGGSALARKRCAVPPPARSSFAAHLPAHRLSVVFPMRNDRAVLARRLSFPLTMAKEEGLAAEMQKILFAAAVTPESGLACGHARLLAERFGARLTLYHALDAPAERYGDAMDDQDDRRGRWGARARQE